VGGDDKILSKRGERSGEMLAFWGVLRYRQERGKQRSLYREGGKPEGARKI